MAKVERIQTTKVQTVTRKLSILVGRDEGEPEDFQLAIFEEGCGVLAQIGLSRESLQELKDKINTVLIGATK